MGLLFTAGSARAEYIYAVLPMGSVSPYVTGISNSGTVIGTMWAETSYAGFAYAGGSYQTVMPEGWTESSALGISGNGYITGYGVTGDYVNKGFVYNGTAYTELLPTGYAYVSGQGVNGSGAVAGYGYGDATGSANRGFVYTPGATEPYTELLPGGWTESLAMGINDAGTVVGYGLAASGYSRGFIYSGSTYTELSVDGWMDLYAQAINAGGMVAGYVSNTDDEGTTLSRGFLYDGGSYQLLLPDGWLYAYALGINSSGAVVGYGKDGSTNLEKGFVFLDGQYSEILPGEGWDFVRATGINDAGVIAGWGVDPDGNTNGFTAAVPVPATLVLLSSGMAALAGLRRRQRR